MDVVPRLRSAHSTAPPGATGLHAVRNGLRAAGLETLSDDELTTACGLSHVPLGAGTGAESHQLSLADVVSFDDFVRVYNAARIVTVFAHLDADSNGELCGSEIRKAFKELGAHVDDAVIAKAISRMDTDNSGTLDLKEFYKTFSGSPGLDLMEVHRLFTSDFSGDGGSEFAPGPPPKGHMSPVRFVLAGAVSGSLSRTLTAPLERIKIIAQTATVAGPGSTAQAVSPWTTIRGIARSEGLGGMFRGNMAAVVRAVPFSGTVCLVYSQTIKVLPADDELDALEPVWRFLAGSLAGGAAATLTYPLDLARARMSVVSSQPATLWQTLRGVMSSPGAGSAGMWRGLSPTLLAVAPFIAVQQSSYDVIKAYAVNECGAAPTAPLFVGLGGVAGCIAQCVVHPIDLVRRRMQVRTNAAGGTGTVQAIRDIVATEGVRGLYRGLGPACLKVAPAVAVSLLVRDAILGRVSG